MIVLNIIFDTIEYNIKFIIDNQCCVEIKRLHIDENTTIPLYNLEKLDEISTLVAGQYIITDVVMPTFVDLITDHIIKYYIFKLNVDQNSVETRYISLEGDNLVVPFFISDNTPDDDIDKLTKKQMEFASIYNDFILENKGLFWEDTIDILYQNGYLTDFLCIINIERKLLGVTT